MKKNFIYFFIGSFLFMGFLFSSCEDDFSEKDAILLEEDLRADNNLVEYSVMLVDASNSTKLKSTNNSSAIIATVIVSQGDSVIEKETDRNGIAVFNNLKLGTVAVKIKADGFSTVNYIAELEGESTAGGLKMANMISMLSTTENTVSLKGKITYEKDLTNNKPEPAANVNVLAIIDASSSSGIDNSIYGTIKEISYSGLSLKSKTDDNGNFEIKVPATSTSLKYKVSVESFETEQTLFMVDYNGKEAKTADEIKRVVTTTFGTDQYLSYVPTNIPYAVLTFDAPTGVGGTGATAVAEIENKNGIESVSLTDNGYNYSNNTYYLTVKNPSSTYNATLRLNVSDNRVQKIDVQNRGEDYNGFDELTFPHQYVEFKATPRVDTSGKITGIYIQNGGQFLISDPSKIQFNIHTSTGSNARLSCNLTWNGSYYYINNVYIGDGGSNYSSNDSITVNVNIAQDNIAKAKVNLSSSEVVAIAVTNAGNGYSNNVKVEISGGGGEGAEGIAHVVQGKITYIEITDKGYGYTSNPEVNIYDLNQPKQADPIMIYSGNFNDNGSLKLSNLYISDSNYGYIEKPLVTVSAVNEGEGINAIAIVNNSSINEVVFTKPGKDYFAGNITKDIIDEVRSVSVQVSLEDEKIVNIYLGQGQRK